MAPRRGTFRGRRYNHTDASPERKPDFSKLIRTRGNHIYFYCPVTEESIIELIIKVHECKDVEARRLEASEEEEDYDDGDSEHSSSSGGSSQGANEHQVEKGEPATLMTPLIEPVEKGNVQVYIHLFTEVSASSLYRPTTSLCMFLWTRGYTHEGDLHASSLEFPPYRGEICRAESSLTTGSRAYCIPRKTWSS